MKHREIQVESYAGGRADERPRKITIDGYTHIVARLLAGSIEKGLESPDEVRRYELLTTGGSVLEVVRRPDGRWFLKSERHRDF
jgi:hypothetical protein